VSNLKDNFHRDVRVNLAYYKFQRFPEYVPTTPKTVCEKRIRTIKTDYIKNIFSLVVTDEHIEKIIKYEMPKCLSLPNTKITNILYISNLLSLIEGDNNSYYNNIVNINSKNDSESNMNFDEIKNNDDDDDSIYSAKEREEEINTNQDCISELVQKHNILRKQSEKLYEDWIKYYYSKHYLDISYNIRNSNEDYIKKNMLLIKNMPLLHEIIKEQSNEKLVQLEIGKKCKTLVLDLDETLIHCDFSYDYQCHDEYLVATLHKMEYDMPIIMRPYLRKFLDFASKNFEVIIYTASDKNYADIILDHLDPENCIFSYRFYRSSLINITDKISTKPLTILGNRNPENIIIVDNSIFNFLLNLDNGYLIPSFYSDRFDVELLKLEHYLKKEILNSEDVRPINKKKFNF